jgi:dTDP-4-amino-4,6-dideoxygalactose transaminase
VSEKLTKEPCVRFVDLPAQFTALEPEITAAVMGVLARGDYILGRAVAEFETAFAAYCGTVHAIGCANGLDGLTLLLQAAEIGPGDEVITQCNSFATAATPGSEARLPTARQARQPGCA